MENGRGPWARARRLGEDFTRYTVSYQVTMNIGDSAEEARNALGSESSPNIFAL